MRAHIPRPARAIGIVAVSGLLLCARPARADSFLFGFTSEPASLQLTYLTCCGETTATFSTTTSEFNAGTANQGWWSTDNTSYNENADYIVGNCCDGSSYHDFFTFDLSGFSGQVIGATLQLARGKGSRQAGLGGPAALGLGLWDVTTDPATLNDKANNPNLVIYDDLGSGINYGNFNLPTTGNPTDTVPLTLNQNAITAVNNAEGGFFSIGGALPTPEPGTFMLLGIGLAQFARLFRRRLKHLQSSSSLQ
jgi:hypothetical protein